MPECPYERFGEDCDELFDVPATPIAMLEWTLRAHHAAHDRRVRAIEALQAQYADYDQSVRELEAEIRRLRAEAAAEAAADAAQDR